MTTILKPGLIDRHPTMNDIPGMVELLNNYWSPLLGMRDFSVQGSILTFTAPRFDMEKSVRIVQTPDGQLAGCIYVTDIISPPVHPEVLGGVQPGFQNQGIGTFLIQWAEKRLQEVFTRVPPHARIVMRMRSNTNHEPTMKLFKKMGLKAIRDVIMMVTNLEKLPPEPLWPQGIYVSSLQEFKNIRKIYLASEEIFRDHWDYVTPNEEEMLQQWHHEVEQDQCFDPSLWFLLMDGNEIAGLALCEPTFGEFQDMGYISTMGIRRAWRRKGLALKLLHYVFREFHRRGNKRVGLSVDGGNFTGAADLYKKGGMKIVRTLTTFEKELRPGSELGLQKLTD